MPYEINRISPRRYQVINTDTNEVHAKNSTLKNAKAQLRLLGSLKGGARCCFNSSYCNGTAHYRRAKTRVGGALRGDEVDKFVKASYEDRKGKTERIGDYELDKSLSNATTKVYHDPKTNKTIVANRGTKSTSIRDWSNNAMYAVGLYDKTGRYKQAEDTQRNVIKKYGKDSITNVGHSQGAIITRNLKDKGLTNELINVNPASKGEKIRRGEVVIKSSGDIVSALVPTGKNVKIIPATSYNPLAEHSSSILEGNETMYGKGRMVGTNPNTYTPRYIGGSLDYLPRRFL